MSELRTADLTYGEDYWNSLDGGAGYSDSVMWQDLAVFIRETFGYSKDLDPWRDITNGMNHLDMGCAFGFLTRHLRHRNIESWGADVSTYCVNGADSDIRPHLRTYDLTGETSPWTLPGWPYQLVTCIETLEHIPEEHVDRALGHLVECVKPGGFLLLTICVDSRPGWDSDPTHVTVKPRAWWDARLANLQGVERCYDREEELLRYYLFHDHDGIFVLTRR